MPNGHLYVVGQLYLAGRTSWPERTEYNYRGNDHELRIFLASPTAGEIEGISGAPAEFALAVEGSALFLLSQFGDGTPGLGMPWSDTPYSWWLVLAHERQLPNPEPGSEERILLHVLLIDATTGILKAMRALTFSPEFSRALINTIRRQARTSFDKVSHDNDINLAYHRYPSTQDMVDAAIARCKGGE